MNEQDLLEPEKLYRSELKEKHHNNVVSYFDELVKESKINIEENNLTCDKVYSKQEEKKTFESKLGKTRFVKFLGIFSIILGAIGLLVAVISFCSNEILVGVLSIVIGLMMIAGGILLLVLIVRPKQKLINEKIDKLNKEIKELTSLAWSQVDSLNQLFDETMPAMLFNKTVPLIKMDRIFDTKKLEFLVKVYDFNQGNRDNVSTLNIQSGTILGNPFAFFKDYRMMIVPHQYEGTLVITYQVRHYGKNGTYYTTHTQTLHAYVTKPRPEYSTNTYLIYGNEAAPNLSFSRSHSNINSMNEKEIEQYVAKHEKDLRKMAEKEMKSGGQYTPLGNAEFELFFGGLNRDHEVEYRLLFTPLAQKSMLTLLKSKEGYGDDFTFVKNKKINIINSLHNYGDALFVTRKTFVDFDYRNIKDKFIEYNDNYFKAVYFDFAPLLSIPLYQQHKAQEYIYKGTIPSNFTSYEHEIISNKYDVHEFIDPRSSTDAILKTSIISKKGENDIVQVSGHTFQAFKEVEYIPILGGDGRMHSVPVVWYRYEPLVKTTKIVVGDSKASLRDYQKLGNKDVIFSRGLVSYNQDKNLNISIEEIKSKMTKN